MSAQRSEEGYGAVMWNGEIRLARRRNTPEGVYGRGRHAPRSGVLALGMLVYGRGRHVPRSGVLALGMLVLRARCTSPFEISLKEFIPVFWVIENVRSGVV